MQRFAPAFLLLLVAACGGLHSDIQGSWMPDTDAMDSAEAKMAAAMIKRIEITSDEITFEAEFMGQSKSSTMKYTVKSEEGDVITLEFEEEGVKREGKITVDGDRLKITDKGMTLVLKPK